MTQIDTRNRYLLDLLALQQDGRLAISAPTNWTNHEPLLEVETEVDAIIEELCESILVGDRNDTAHWYFFVGSPGNGKSAAMGKLCRLLMLRKGCQVCDEAGVSINDLESTDVPYAINVYEGSKKFASAQIVQDASVVRNPFTADIDPAKELLGTLKNAWEKGISLIVCTNRGVLEKAHRDHHMNRDINSEPWFKVVKDIVEKQKVDTIRQFQGKKCIFRNFKVNYYHLDNRSLLLGNDIFARLIEKAVDGANWTSCTSCSVMGLCPFKSNRDWLYEGGARRQVLLLLKRAEVLSGQVIVFREALAIISLVLAGCPRDYDSMNPCDWVREKVASGDIFSLASRRLYMSLFASFCPHGLEAFSDLRERQLEAFRGLHESLSESSNQMCKAIGHVLESPPPSSDVGVTRLLGEDGVIASLDPCREALPTEFYDQWDADFDAVPTSGRPCFSDIERICLSVWKEMEEGLELANEYSVSEGFWALRRWSSNFLLHFGALLEGKSAWADGLDKFTKLLELMTKSPSERTIEDKRIIKDLDTSLKNLLNVSNINQPSGSIRLSDAVTLVGQWVQEKLKPKTSYSEGSGSISLVIKFEGGEQAVFAAPMYLWLNHRLEGKLDARCFPQELLEGVEDARVRAASKGKYAFENDDVELLINAYDDGQFRLTRFEGDVEVTHDPRSV